MIELSSQSQSLRASLLNLATRSAASEMPWENYSILDAFDNLMAACSQAEWNSGRHFLVTVSKYISFCSE